MQQPTIPTFCQPPDLRTHPPTTYLTTRVRTESWILEKVLKFVQQFFRPGKSLENGGKVWKNGKKSWFFFKATTSASEKVLILDSKTTQLPACQNLAAILTTFLQIPTYHPSHLPPVPLILQSTNAASHLISLPSYLPTYLPSLQSSYLPANLPAYLSAYLPTYIHTYLPPYQPTYIRANLPTYLTT